MLTEEAVLRRLRKICLGLPGATETRTFGHPTFQIARKTFAVLEEYKGELGICFKVGELLQGVFLKDVRFFRTPYIGKHGWVTLRGPRSTAGLEGGSRARKRQLPISRTEEALGSKSTLEVLDHFITL